MVGMEKRLVMQGLVALLVGMTVVMALPTRKLDPSQILLKNLPAEKLDSLLEAQLAQLEEDISGCYEEQLLAHQEAIHRLHLHFHHRSSHSISLATNDLTTSTSNRIFATEFFTTDSFLTTDVMTSGDFVSIDDRTTNDSMAVGKALITDHEISTKPAMNTDTITDTLTTGSDMATDSIITFDESLRSIDDGTMVSNLLPTGDTLTSDGMRTDGLFTEDILTSLDIFVPDDLKAPEINRTMNNTVTSVRHVDNTTATVDGALVTEDFVEDLNREYLGNLPVSIMDSLENGEPDHFQIPMEMFATSDSVEDFERRPRSSQDYSHVWHSWHSSLNDIESRDKLVVEEVRVGATAANLKVSEVIPLNLWNLSAIFRSEDGIGYHLEGQRLQPLLVRNNWTIALTGCPCRNDSSQMCACCTDGSCSCTSNHNTCVPCPYADNKDTCHTYSTQPLELDTAVGFQYFLGYYDPQHGLQRVLVVAKDTTVTFFTIDQAGLQHLSPVHALSSLTFSRPITHLGYGETYRDLDGVIQKVRFLVCFRAGDRTHQFQGLGVDTRVAFGELVSWDGEGSEMRTWQSGGRMMVGVLQYNSLTVYEMKANHHHQYSLRPVQKIETILAIVHWSTLSLGFDNYLMLVSSSLARLYLLSGVSYQHVQDILPSHSITAFRAVVPLAVQRWRGKAVLLTGEGTKLQAYVLNGSSQKFVLEYSTELSVAVQTWTTGYGFSGDFSQISEFVFVQGEHGPVILEVHASINDLPDPVDSQTQALDAKIASLKASCFVMLISSVEAAKERLERSVDQSNIFYGNIIVLQGIIVNGTLSTGDITTKEVVVEEQDGRQEAYQAYLTNLAHFKSVLSTLNFTVGQIHLRLDDAVPATGSSRLITGVKTMVGGSLTVNHFTTNHIIVSQVLDERGSSFPLDSIIEGLVRRGDRRVITGTKTFFQAVQIGNLMTRFLGDIPIADLVTTNGNHTISAATTFTSPLVAHTINVLPGGTVGGIDLSEEAVLLSGNVTLGGCVFREDVIVNSLTSSSKQINGVNIERLATSTLTTQGGTILGSLVFTSSFSVDTLTATTIMGVNVKEYMSTTVFMNRPAILQGMLVASMVKIQGELSVQGLINGKNFPSDYPLRTDSKIIFNTKKFRSVSVERLTAGPNSLVDGLPLEKLVTLHTPQVITGHKTFAQGVYIEGNLDITSKIIDGVNLDNLNASLGQIGTSDFKFDVIFKQEVRVPSLTYGGTLNGIDFTTLLKDIVYSDEPIVISSNKIFRNGVSITNASFHSTLNGASFSNLVTTSNIATGVITGSKVFAKDVVFTDITVGSLDGVDLDDLIRTAVYLNKPGQVVYGTKVLTQTLKTRELVVTGRLGDVDFTKIVTKSTDQTFIVTQSLRSANFTDLLTVELQMPAGATVNGIELTSLYSRRVSLTSPGFYTGTISVKGPVSVLNSLTVGYINGRPATSLANDFVMRDEHSVLTGQLTFANLTIHGPITTQNLAGANGFNISDIDLHALKVTENNVISGSLEWGNITFHGDIGVAGLVDGINLQQLSQDVVLRNSTTVQIITGEKRFEGGITVLGDIEATLVNGFNLRKHLLTRDTTQVITAHYNFLNIKALSEVILLGRYNGFNLTTLTSSNLLSNGSTYHGNVTFYGDVSVGRLTLSGNYNGVNVNDHLADSIPLNANNVNIMGMKTFTAAVTDFQEINVVQLNAQPFDHILRELVLTDVPTNLPNHMTITGRVSAPMLQARSLTVKGNVGGVDFGKLMTEAAYVNRNHTFTSILTFARNISVTGALDIKMLNGTMVEDILTTSTPQTIHGNFTIGRVLSSDVHVHGLVNSWKLPVEVADTLKAVEGQTVRGPLTLVGSIEVLRDVEVTGRVGSTAKVDLSTQVVHLHQPSHIQGSLVFEHPLMTSNLTVLPGVVSGVNIPLLIQSAWNLNSNTTLTGNLVFLQPVVFKVALNQNQLEEKIVLEDYTREVNKALAVYTSMVHNLTDLYESTCERVAPLHRQLENSVFEMDYFQSVVEDVFPRLHHSSTAFTAFNNSYLIVSWSEKCESTWYVVGSTSGFVSITSTSAAQRGWGQDWLFLGEADQEAYVAVAGSSDDQCGSQSAVWKMDSTGRITLHKPLSSGQHLSAFPDSVMSGVVRLQVHATNLTTSYLFSLASGLLQQVDTKIETSATEHICTLVTLTHTRVAFKSYGSRGMLFVNGVAGEVVEVERSIDDCVLMEGGTGRREGGRVLLLLSVTREGNMHEEEFALELSLVNLESRTLLWMDHEVMRARTLITAFHTGSSLSGSWVVVTVEEGREPIVYTMLGEMLKEVARLSTLDVTWMQHLTAPGYLHTLPIHSTWPTHYLLLGRESGAYVLARPVDMRGLCCHGLGPDA
ncbi:hypothetical protein Pmani_033696 [Petrolisthes manimaculis]|uniref:Uncharacterized protein n=1 Tax=Petrolisthes manimaculis TaxID=1843537 RepID=A0AAE1NPY1_9EUCA|nr:hypothetical protein Pmani_033696 [Petrolisthes manimaculis]